MYEAFYKLTVKPFQLNPDPNFYFGSRGHKRAMSYLEYGLHQGEGFIVITGEVGAGKTTLVRNLFVKLERDNVVGAQLVSTQLDADEILRMVTASFGLAHEEVSKAVLLKKLEGFLLACHKQGKRALLVVDEAQNLTQRAVEELRMLSNFQIGEKSLMQSFLLGQPEFRQTLQGEGMQQLRQRVIASYHLGPMDATDTRAYIEHRLNTAGWGGDPSFSDVAHAAIFDYTGGIPRRINTVCDRLMLMGYLEEKHAFDVAEVNDVVADLQREFNVPGAANEELEKPTPENGAGPHGGAQISRLDERVSQMEKSLVSVLNLSREILAFARTRGIRKERR
jgi:general secretion pathway protein A